MWCVLLWMSAQQAAWGDVLYLSSGRRVEGVVVDETPSHITVQVSWKGYVTFDRQALARVVRGDDQIRERLLSAWRREFLEDQQREHKRRAFEAAQRARGLVRYKGEWITREELAFVREEQRRRERQRREEEAQRAAEEEAKRVAQRLQALEEEHRRLQQQLLVRQRLWVVPESVIVRHHHPKLFRDEHGNLMRVREHDGHQFFTTTDGQHVNLESHDGHFAFTDAQGIHHDLEP
jgi:hypothetical protein